MLRRTWFAPLVPASLLLAVLTSVTVTTALASFGARALPAAAHQRLAGSPAATIQVSGQIGAARAGADLHVIAAAIRSVLGAVPFTVVSGQWSDQLALPAPHRGNQVPQIQAAVLGHVMAHAELTAGTWPGPRKPGQPIGVVLPAAAAGMLRFSVGQSLVLRDSLTGAPARLRVTGLFRPRDPAAPFWRLSLLGTSGKVVQGSFVTYGPMLVNPAAFGPGGLTAGAASWLITVDTARIPPGDLGRLGQRLGAVASGWQGNQGLGGLQVSTALPRTLSALADSLVVSRSLLLIGSLQLLLLATAAAALAARLLASQREEETALLSARGGARAQLVLASLAEASLLAVVGAAAGLVLGGYLANLLISVSGLPPGSSAGGFFGAVRQVGAGSAWWPAVVIMVLVIVVVMWPALRPVTPGAARLRRGRQAALASTARAGLDAALIILGVLALWELHRYSAAPRLSGSGLGIDPVLALAPALALAGIALLPLRVLPAAARLLDRLGARSRRLAAALASWQVSRRAVREGTAVLLVVLAVATGTLVLAQHQSWRQSQLDQAAFDTGADVRVDLAAPLPLGRGAALAHASGVRSAMPVSSTSSGFDVVALDAAKAAGVVQLRPDLSALPAAALWKRITPGHAVPGPGPPGQAGPAGHQRQAHAAARGPARPDVGEPVRAGRLGHRLRGPGRAPARRWPLSPSGHQPGRRRAGELPAPAAGLVAQLPDAGAPATGFPGPRGHRQAGHPCPGGLAAGVRWLPGSVRPGRPDRRPVSHGGIPGSGLAGSRGKAAGRHRLAGQRGRGGADLHGRIREPPPA